MPERTSKRQQELLQFIDGFIKGNGYGPSYREVMRALGYKSVSTVAVHVDGLIAKGYLRKRDRSARSLEVVTRGTPTKPETDAHTTWLKAFVRGKAEKMSSDEREQVATAFELMDLQDIATSLREYDSSQNIA